MRQKVFDQLAAHPAFDWCGLFVGAIFAVLFVSRFEVTVSQAQAFLTGSATLGGLVMAVAAFACALVYQSGSKLVSRTRDKYSKELKTNWVSIFSSTIFGSGVLVFLLLFSNTTWTVVVGSGVLMWLLLKGARSAWWLYYVMFLDSIESKVVPLPAPKPNLERFGADKAS